MEEFKEEEKKDDQPAENGSNQIMDDANRSRKKRQNNQDPRQIQQDIESFDALEQRHQELVQGQQ